MNAALSATHAAQVQTAWTLPIEGMTCASCAARVERSLRSVSGVVDATYMCLDSLPPQALTFPRLEA